MLRQLIWVKLLMVLSSDPVYAEWMSLGVAQNGTTTVYIDPLTIRPKGELVKMWSLLDFKTAQFIDGLPYFSSKLQAEFDCSEELVRYLAKGFFEANMGGGALLYSDSVAGEWRAVPPSSITKNLMDVACVKP